jgi:hypothetical protein
MLVRPNRQIDQKVTVDSSLSLRALDGGIYPATNTGIMTLFQGQASSAAAM